SGDHEHQHKKCCRTNLRPWNSIYVHCSLAFCTIDIPAASKHERGLLSTVMAYQIIQRLFAMNDTFDITDDDGYPKYQVRGRVFRLGKALDLFDKNGEHCIEIRQQLMAALPEYDFKANGEVVGHLRKTMTLFKPNYEIDGPCGEYTMDGDWLGMNYTISDG